MRSINNTIRWARKTNAHVPTYHMVADQTDTGDGPRAACNRSYLLDLHGDVAPGYTGQTADQIYRSTYGMFCDRCRVRAEKITTADQIARDTDHAAALDMTGGTTDAPAFSGPAAHRPLAIECAMGCGRVFGGVDAELVDHQDACNGPAAAETPATPVHRHEPSFRHPIVATSAAETGTCRCGARIIRRNLPGLAPVNNVTPYTVRDVEPLAPVITRDDVRAGRVCDVDAAHAMALDAVATDVAARTSHTPVVSDAIVDRFGPATHTDANVMTPDETDPDVGGFPALPASALRPAPTYRWAFTPDPSICANTSHDHTTTDDGMGGTLPDGAHRLMTCNGCGVPAHYNHNVGDYVHNNPNVAGCPLVAENMGDDPCMWPAPFANDRVVFRPNDMPACWNDRYVAGETVFTVVAVTYGVGGQMDAETRAQIDAGHAHVIMTDPDGRRIGTTSARLMTTDDIVVEIITYDETWAAANGTVVKTDPVARGMGRATTVHVVIPNDHARSDVVAGQPVVRFTFPTTAPRDMPAAPLANIVPASRVVSGDPNGLARVDAYARYHRGSAMYTGPAHIRRGRIGHRSV